MQKNKAKTHRQRKADQDKPRHHDIYILIVFLIWRYNTQVPLIFNTPDRHNGIKAQIIFDPALGNASLCLQFPGKVCKAAAPGA